MNKAIIAIDSFKGCLTSEEAGSAVMEGIKTIFPDCETLLFPIADGGEGMLDILTSATKGKYRTLPAHGPLMELVQGRYGISGRRANSSDRDGSRQRLAFGSRRQKESDADDYLRDGRTDSRRPRTRLPPFYRGHRRQCHQRCRVRYAASLRVSFPGQAGKSVGDRRQDHVAGSLHRYICRTSGFKGGPLHDCLRCTQSLLRV